MGTKNIQIDKKNAREYINAHTLARTQAYSENKNEMKDLEVRHLRTKFFRFRISFVKKK